MAKPLLRRLEGVAGRLAATVQLPAGPPETWTAEEAEALAHLVTSGPAAARVLWARLGDAGLAALAARWRGDAA